ncbi:hypothetical protein GCM10010218_45460 [Streptomyces mashuensis]|uniref:SH3 domain-containing protein n=1 Tax=Streptomyces mashuensis TaxID=33904 RepID=A0A919B7F7_9ACTN|nr:SH3 domain-containing protein [Streptomyces mashuensis]GHF58977.1 hypothetical protein GCM10010218_45460 [Streptomyces mashuensis]
MFSSLMARGMRIAAGVIAAAALGGTLLTAVPAQAADGEEAPVPLVRPYGTVTAPSGINERTFPSTDSPVRAVLKYHGQAGLRCKVRAQEVGGNAFWYLLRDRPSWVTARFVDTTGEVPYCRSVNRTALDESPASHRAVG